MKNGVIFPKCQWNMSHFALLVHPMVSEWRVMLLCLHLATNGIILPKCQWNKSHFAILVHPIISECMVPCLRFYIIQSFIFKMVSFYQCICIFGNYYYEKWCLLTKMPMEQKSVYFFTYCLPSVSGCKVLYLNFFIKQPFIWNVVLFYQNVNGINVILHVYRPLPSP